MFNWGLAWKGILILGKICGVKYGLAGVFMLGLTKPTARWAAPIADGTPNPKDAAVAARREKMSPIPLALGLAAKLGRTLGASLGGGAGARNIERTGGRAGEPNPLSMGIENLLLLIFVGAMV